MKYGKHTPIREEAAKFHSGFQTVFRFENGYGASLIEGGMAYGGRELAVVKFDPDEPDAFNIVYDTGITTDVLGYLRESDVVPLLDQIEAL